MGRWLSRYNKLKGTIWNLHLNEDGTTPHCDAELCVLMEIREELQRLNTLLGCSNFTDIPHKLERIARNTSATRKLLKEQLESMED